MLHSFGQTVTLTLNRAVHNSFARNDPFALDELDHDGGKEDAYHFVSYLPIGDELYELDGLAPQPKK